MKTFYKILAVFSLFLFVALSVYSDTNAEPPFRAKERIEQLKKIKLLDVLELNEERTTEFLAKYNQIERKTEEKKLNVEHEMKLLEMKIKNAAPENEIKEQTQKALTAYKDFHRSMEEKMEEMKEMLTDIEFAKFIVFETQFHDEVRKIIMKNYRKRQGRGGDRGPRP